MAAKKTQAASAPATAQKTATATAAPAEGQAVAAQVETGTAVADPSPARELTEASGAIVEPQIVDAVDVTHEAIDANPRAGTTADQNRIDLNDAKRAAPADADFAGQGIDRSVYGTPTASATATTATTVNPTATPAATTGKA